MSTKKIRKSVTSKKELDSKKYGEPYQTTDEVGKVGTPLGLLPSIHSPGRGGGDAPGDQRRPDLQSVLLSDRDVSYKNELDDIMNKSKMAQK